MLLEKKHILFKKAIVLTLLLWFFALLVPLAFPWKILAILSLVGAAFLISNIQLLFPEAAFHKNLWKWRPNLGWFIVFFLFISTGLSIFTRIQSGMPHMPISIGDFAYLAILIGIMEELVFRGFIQGAVSVFNVRLGIILAALGHAGYKSLLFILTELPIDISILSLFVVTFSVGIILGISRSWSQSLWPAILSHALFDFWVYGEQDAAPWWVW